MARRFSGPSAASTARASVVLSKSVEKSLALEAEVSCLRHHVSVLSKRLHLFEREVGTPRLMGPVVPLASADPPPPSLRPTLGLSGICVLFQDPPSHEKPVCGSPLVLELPIEGIVSSPPVPDHDLQLYSEAQVQQILFEQSCGLWHHYEAQRIEDLVACKCLSNPPDPPPLQETTRALSSPVDPPGPSQAPTKPPGPALSPLMISGCTPVPAPPIIIPDPQSFEAAAQAMAFRITAAVAPDLDHLREQLLLLSPQPPHNLGSGVDHVSLPSPHNIIDPRVDEPPSDSAGGGPRRSRKKRAKKRKVLHGSSDPVPLVEGSSE